MTPADTHGLGQCATTATTWLCGVVATLADAELIFSSSPALGFLLFSAAGAGVGFCARLEAGNYDHDPVVRRVRSFVTRLAIGAGIGVCAAIAWRGYGSPPPGLWLLCTGAASAFPLEAARWIKKRFFPITRGEG